MQRIACALLVIITTTLLATAARAGQYPGWGDTGWVYASKRECCDGAIAIAQQYSAAACSTAGGEPRPLHGGVQRRGFCNWESGQDDNGQTVFRCRADATVPCR